MNRKLVAIMAAVFALPFIANAQEYEGESHRTMQPSGDISLQGGVANYDRHLASRTNVGPAYGVRLGLSPIRNIGVEIAYNGAYNNLRDRISSSGSLITNEVGGNLRLNAVPAFSQLPANFTPYLFGGAFYHRIDTNDFTPGIRAVNAFALPVGAGFDVGSGSVLVGARFTYNFLFNEKDALGGDSDSWVATVNLGARLGH